MSLSTQTLLLCDCCTNAWVTATPPYLAAVTHLLAALATSVGVPVPAVGVPQEEPRKGSHRLLGGQRDVELDCVRTLDVAAVLTPPLQSMGSTACCTVETSSGFNSSRPGVGWCSATAAVSTQTLCLFCCSPSTQPRSCDRRPVCPHSALLSWLLQALHAPRCSGLCRHRQT